MYLLNSLNISLTCDVNFMMEWVMVDTTRNWVLEQGKNNKVVVRNKLEEGRLLLSLWGSHLFCGLIVKCA